MCALEWELQCFNALCETICVWDMCVCGLRERERERGFTGASLLASMCCCHTEYEEGGRHSSGGFLCLSLTFSVQDFLQDVATKTVPDPLHLAYPILL